MNSLFSKISDLVYKAVASSRFFLFTMVVFVLQSLWLAFSAIYPMPFDEYVHVGVIQLYAKQWSPFIIHQPISSGVLGDVTREPSFLYHWLMGFVYKFFDVFLNNPNYIIAGLRLVNILFVVVGILVFYKLLREWKVSRRIINLALLVFVFTPIIPFLAAQVNYDNLMFMLTPLVLLYGGRLINSNKNLIQNFAMFIFLSITATLVKQTFLPLLLVAFIYVVVALWSRNRNKIWSVILTSWKQTPKDLSFGLIFSGIIIVSSLGVARYGGNIVRYGTFMPKCELVQPVILCQQNGPWYRNKVSNVQNKPSEAPYGNPASFSQYWATRMMRGYFAIFAHTPTQVVSNREPYGPIATKPLLPLQVWIASFVTVAGLVAAVCQRKKLWDDKYLRFALVSSTFYIVVLWIFNYNSYLKMWKAEAIQARYTLPVLILVLVLFAQAINWSIASKKIKSALVLGLFVSYIWGGGIAGWIIRADDTWRWQDSTIQTINHKTQSVLWWTIVH